MKLTKWTKDQIASHLSQSTITTNGYVTLPSGDYSEVMDFKQKLFISSNSKFAKGTIFRLPIITQELCSFGASTSFLGSSMFGSENHFGPRCNFQDKCTFNRYCIFKNFCLFGADCYFEEVGDFGTGCKFSNDCTFGPDSRIGSKCVIGSYSVIGSGSVIQEKVTLGDCIEVENNCNFYTGCTFGVDIHFGSNIVFTGKTKIENKLTLVQHSKPIMRLDDPYSERCLWAYNCVEGIYIKTTDCCRLEVFKANADNKLKSDIPDIVIQGKSELAFAALAEIAFNELNEKAIRYYSGKHLSGSA